MEKWYTWVLSGIGVAAVTFMLKIIAAIIRKMKSKDKLGLEFVDVGFVKNSNFLTLDIKLRNTAEKTAFLSKVIFNVQKVWRIIPPMATCGVVESSAKYDIVLPSKEIPYTQSMSISHAIQPNDVDRFMIALDVKGDYIYLATFDLIYDGDNKSINSGNLLFFIPAQNSIYSHSDYSYSLEQSKSLKGIGWIFHNKKILDEISAISAIKNQELQKIESYILNSLPYLENTLTSCKRQLIELSDGKRSSRSEIDYLLNPELHIEIKDFGVTSSEMTDIVLLHLKCLTKLQELDIKHSKDVSDKGIVHLKHLINLRQLDLSWTSVTDAGLESICELEKLEGLHLRGIKIGDMGLAHLKMLKRLRELSIMDTLVSDAGLIHLRDLKELTSLNFLRVSITSNGLEYLKDLSNLETLNLCRTCVGDEGLSHLQGLERLKLLDLSNTQITDEGLGYLCRLTKLESIDLSGCHVTNTGLAYLRDLKTLKVCVSIGQYKWISICDLFK